MWKIRRNIITEKKQLAYAGWLRAEEKAEATVEKYCREVKAFADWLSGAKVTKEAACEYKKYLIGEKGREASCRYTRPFKCRYHKAVFEGKRRKAQGKDKFARVGDDVIRLLMHLTFPLFRYRYSKKWWKPRGRYDMMCLCELLFYTGDKPCNRNYIMRGGSNNADA